MSSSPLVMALTFFCHSFNRLSWYAGSFVSEIFSSTAFDQMFPPFNGNVRYHLKTPYRDGTTHVIFESLDFIAKLAAMVPRPRVNLTRFHGVLAPNSNDRINVTPAKRGKGSAKQTSSINRPKSSVDCHKSLTWAERLKRVFKIDVSVCSRCGGDAERRPVKSSLALRTRC